MQNALHMAGIHVDWGFTLVFGSLVLTRLTLITATIPFLVGKPVPAQLKLGLSLALLLYLYPLLKPDDPSVLPTERLPLLVLFLKESFYGIVIGFVAGIVFYGFEAAGKVVDNQRGAAQARLLIPQLGEQSSIFGGFYFQLALVLFLVIGGHRLFFAAVIESYQILPILELPRGQVDLLALMSEVIRTTGSLLVLAVQIAAPVFIAIFMADIILGITNRIAPAINVWELGFAVRGVVGVVVVYLSLGVVISQFTVHSTDMINEIRKLILALRPLP